MVTKKNWNEFRETGLLLFINQFLHIFGWAIVTEIDEETNEVINAYPARVKFRGFGEKNTTKAYQKLTQYMVDNSNELNKEVD